MRTNQKFRRSECDLALKTYFKKIKTFVDNNNAKGFANTYSHFVKYGFDLLVEDENSTVERQSLEGSFCFPKMQQFWFDFYFILLNNGYHKYLSKVRNLLLKEKVDMELDVIFHIGNEQIGNIINSLSAYISPDKKYIEDTISTNLGLVLFGYASHHLESVRKENRKAVDKNRRTQWFVDKSECESIVNDVFCINKNLIQLLLKQQSTIKVAPIKYTKEHFDEVEALLSKYKISAAIKMVATNHHFSEEGFYQQYYNRWKKNKK